MEAAEWAGGPHTRPGPQAPCLDEHALEPSEDTESLSLIGQGLTSCTQVPGLQNRALTSVCLHGNNVTAIEGLGHLTRLQHLNISSNAVASLKGIQGKYQILNSTSEGSLGSVQVDQFYEHHWDMNEPCALCRHAQHNTCNSPHAGLPSLTNLNLSSNRLTGALPPLDGLSSLTHLNLSYNGLTSLQGLHSLLPSSSPSAPPHPLRKLNLKHNLISTVQVQHPHTAETHTSSYSKYTHTHKYTHTYTSTLTIKYTNKHVLTHIQIQASSLQRSVVSTLRMA